MVEPALPCSLQPAGLQGARAAAPSLASPFHSPPSPPCPPQALAVCEWMEKEKADCAAIILGGDFNGPPQEPFHAGEGRGGDRWCCRAHCCCGLVHAAPAAARAGVCDGSSRPVLRPCQLWLSRWLCLAPADCSAAEPGLPVGPHDGARPGAAGEVRGRCGRWRLQGHACVAVNACRLPPRACFPAASQACRPPRHRPPPTPTRAGHVAHRHPGAADGPRRL